MGKGDDLRKMQISKEEFAKNWDKIFNKNNSKKGKNKSNLGNKKSN